MLKQLVDLLTNLLVIDKGQHFNSMFLYNCVKVVNLFIFVDFFKKYYDTEISYSKYS